MPKINSARKAILLLAETGTSKDKLDLLQIDNDGNPLFPTNRRTGEVTGDLPSSKILERAEEIHDEWFAAGEEGVPTFPTLTLDKLKSIIAVGEYRPQSLYQEEFPVEFEDGEDEDLPVPTNASPAVAAVLAKKNKGGRPKGSKNAPKATIG